MNTDESVLNRENPWLFDLTLDRTLDSPNSRPRRYAHARQLDVIDGIEGITI